MLDYQGNKFQDWLYAEFEKDKGKPISERFNMKKAIEMLGVSKTNVYQYFKSQSLGRSTVKKIVDAFGVSEEEIWGDDKGGHSFMKNDKYEPNLWIVPFKAYGGFLSGYGDKVALEQTIEKIYYPLIKGEAFAFQVGGQSAFPIFPENTWFCGKPIESPEDLVKGRLYAWQSVDGIVLKVFDGVDEENFYMSSVNDEHNPVDPMHRKNAKVIYRQVGKLDNFEY